ncbi:TPA: recombinase family protein [Vibrio alginolyticus]|uniref:recombinase family protein n=1 Tax=Vibrio diabolicus TaxID=50719 RepID=UPI00280CF3AF|nr:recombinase family protein [Vibrio alginolyticus]
MSLNHSSTKIPKIYNYARVSSTKQLKGVGLETQQQQSVLEGLSKQYNLPISDESFVDKGLSAYRGSHKEGEFGIVLERINKGVICKDSILVVFSLDRISRETVNIALEQLLSIINRGVRVYTHIDGKMFDANSPNLSADLIVSVITMERANEESKTKSKRVIGAAKEGLKRWRDTGLPQSSLGRCPFWIDQSTNTFNKNAEGVLKAVEMYLSGVGCLKIKQHLDEHYPYEAVRKRGRRTSRIDQWDFTAINQVFTKPSLIGQKHITVDGVKHKLENYYPALIDVLTFQKLKQAKGLKAGRAPERAVNHLLKGLLKCGVCGGSMVFIDKGRGNAATNYICSNAAKGNHKRENYSAQMLELVTLYLCQDHYLNQSNSEQEQAEKVAQLQLQKDRLQDELQGLKERYQLKKRASILDVMENTEDELEAVSIELENLQTVDTEAAFNALTEDVYTSEVMDDFDHPQRKQIRQNLVSIIDKITIIRNEHKSVFTKVGTVNCLVIAVKFRNGQARFLFNTPFEYLDNEMLYTPVGISSNNIKTDLVARPDFIKNLINKLHRTDLLRKLYPSKGNFKWKDKTVYHGIVFDLTTNECEQILARKSRIRIDNQSTLRTWATFKRM